MAKKESSFDNKYGGAFRQVAESPNLDIERIPTGVFSIDKALEGGIPIGRVIEFAGEPATLKSTMALMVAKNALDAGKEVLYIDLESSLSRQYLEFVGIDANDPDVKFHVADPDVAENILDMILSAVDEDRFDLIILDSVAALTSKAEMEGEMGDANVAGVPRLLSKFTRKFMTETDIKTSVIFINQFRDTIGGFGYGPTKKTTGGRAVPYAASLRIEFIRTGPVKSGENVVGSKLKFKIVKSKVCRPYTEPEFEHLFDIGIDVVGNILDAAVEQNIVQKNAGWYAIEGEKFNGKDKVRSFLSENPDVLADIKGKLS